MVFKVDLGGHRESVYTKSDSYIVYVHITKLHHITKSQKVFSQKVMVWSLFLLTQASSEENPSSSPSNYSRERHRETLVEGPPPIFN